VKGLNKETGSRGRGSAALRQQAREVYREAILEAAEDVFVQRGLAGTRMADVARASGLATGTLYNYFANRDALLASLIEQRSQELVVAVRAAAAGDRADARSTLERMVRAGFQHFESHRALFAVLTAVGGISGKPVAGMPRRCMEAIRTYHDLFGAVLGDAVDAGLVRADVPISVLVGFLTGALHGVVRTWIAEPGGASPLVDRAPAVVDLFLRGASTR
jgi:AcrR family transcriptional regulator